MSDQVNERLTPDNTQEQEQPQAPVAPQASPFTTPAAEQTQPAAPEVPANTDVPQAPTETPAEQPAAPTEPVAPLQPTETVAQQPQQAAFVQPSQMPQAPVDNTPAVRTQEDFHPMKAVLDAQRKVLIQIPLMMGEKPGTMLPVGINGYFYYIRKGAMIEVPEAIAAQVNRSINADTRVGEDIDLSNPQNEAKLKNLTR